MSQKLKRCFLIFSVTIFALMTFFAFGLDKSKAAEESEPQVDALPIVQFSDVSTTGLENSPSHPIRVYLSEVATHDVIVDYSVIGGTAVAGEDYLLEYYSLKIREGGSYADINLMLLDNHLVDKTRNLTLGLSGPINAQLGENAEFNFTILDDDSAPVSTLTTVPQVADGQNGWFITKPEFEISTDKIADVYYRINRQDWVVYAGPVTVLEGINLIDYYAFDSYGNIESIKTTTLKVDTVKPSIPSLIVKLESQGETMQANLAWQTDEDSQFYQIWRNGVLIETLSGEKKSFADEGLVVNQSYEYYIIAIDRAGNQSVSGKSTVQFAVKEVIKEVKGTQTIAKPLPKVRKSIAKGVSTEVTEKVSGDETKIVEEQPEKESVKESDSNKANNQGTKEINWNRILLLISVLIILSGLGIGIYYGYGWFLSSKKTKTVVDEKKSKSRW
ncbi:TPA: hypothetical protein DD449_04825 [Candidatus Berkelbacteria bacterium]|uniref:Calx-beta domain-containing protein n=1 Tax=Berkelbacteria bacterium GW2011_GWE1_39_12 TaxID=1618337 RepID=A0A0G4B5U5_9BACT|nr:MAG: hypothetical protein UT28_C0001G0584 [Berkelbacteria bacterium GW2011_GWE1_39_12]HBO60978.1 hypothetical protein [Candidatus Berkelbacteria bacterium]